MSDNIETVHRLYAGFERDDFDVLDELLAADVEYVNPEYAIEGGVRYGVDEFRAALRSLRDDFHWDEIELTRVEEHGDHVLVEFTNKVRGKSSGILISAPVGHVWTFRDGRVSRFQWFRTFEEALAAVAP